MAARAAVIAAIDPRSAASPFVKLLTSRYALIAAIALGCLGRIAWALLTSAPGAAGEAFNIARAIAEGRGFADAYNTTSVPTAHMLPTSPLIAGAVYAAFGVRSFISETILAGYSITLSLGTLLLYYQAFARLGVSLFFRRLALFVGLLLPLYLVQEVVDFRIWEGGLAAFLLALYFYTLTLVIAGVAAQEKIRFLAIANAMLFFVNPAFGIAAYFCSIRALLPVQSVKRLVRYGFMFALPLALLLTPWIARNFLVFGEFIPLRSNAGLELAIGVHPAAVDGRLPLKTFQDRMLSVHPGMNDNAHARVLQPGGEVAYSKALLRETRSWMAQNPVATAIIAGRHIRQMIVPEPWQYQWFGGIGRLAIAKSIVTSFFGIAGLAGLFWGIRKGQVGWQYLATIIVIPMVLLSPFQPVPRYIYLFYPLFLFAATGFSVIREKSRMAPVATGAGTLDRPGSSRRS